MTSSLTPLGDGWTGAKSLPSSGITKPKNIPKKRVFKMTQIKDIFPCI
jgi:hypothetical protein